VIVTVKSPALPDIAARIAPLLTPTTLVAFVMNGIPWWYGNGAPGLPTLAAAIGDATVVGGVVYSACEVASPGHIHVDNARNRLVLGTPDGTIPPALEILAATLRDDGLRVDVTPEIRTEIWAKLVMNLSTAPFAVLATTAPKDYLVEPTLLAAVNAAAEEALAIAAALGLRPSVDPGKQLRAAQSMTHKPSILQDLLLGRKMEIATILDAPLTLARRAGVATPTLDLLSALARVRAREAGLYS
jgi:2-dehydropantoate 2-reductase